MASWYELPTELKHFIINAYIELILEDLNAAGFFFDPGHAHLIVASIAQILDLTNALPFQRREIVDYCNSYEDTVRKKCTPFSSPAIVLTELKRRWVAQSWLEFREQMRSPRKRAVEGDGRKWGETFIVHRCENTG